MAFDYNNYYALEYIESTGSQYIDTGVKPGDYVGNLKVVCDVQLTELSDKTVLGCQNPQTLSQDSRNPFLFSTTSNSFYMLSDNGSVEVIIPTFRGNVIRNVWTLDTIRGMASVGFISFELAGGYSTNQRNIYLFGEYGGITATATNRASMKLYSCAFYSMVGDEEVAIKIFSPAQRIEDGVVGLYEEVEGVFYENRLSAIFIPGPLKFIPPVFDRTQEDVEEVRELNLKVQKGTATEEEMIRWKKDLKGALNESDLIRILSNLGIIADLAGVDIEEQVIPELLTLDWLDTLLDNIQTLIEEIGKYQTTPALPTQPLNTYIKWNDIEKILLDLREVISNWLIVYCGNELFGDNNSLI